MKLLVVSDTHGTIGRLKNILNKYDGITHIIHLGDGVRDLEEISSLYPNICINAVKGNNDLCCDYPEQKVFCLMGHKFFATHGHNCGVRQSVWGVYKKAYDSGADIALFGHTHLKYDKIVDGIHILNPSAHGCIIIQDDNIEFI